jgi:hypothetical protein
MFPVVNSKKVLAAKECSSLTVSSALSQLVCCPFIHKFTKFGFVSDFGLRNFGARPRLLRERGSFSQHLGDEENQDCSAQSASEEQIEKGITHGGEYWDECNHNMSFQFLILQALDSSWLR